MAAIKRGTGEVFWPGFPYTEKTIAVALQKAMTNVSDAVYEVDSHVQPNSKNDASGARIIMTHCGPSDFVTTDTFYRRDGSCEHLETGSSSLRTAILSLPGDHKTPAVWIHGHSHYSRGFGLLEGTVPVVNVGPLKNGYFGELWLETRMRETDGIVDSKLVDVRLANLEES